MLAQMERYLKQAIVSKDAYVASSAVVSSFHLAERGSTDVIKRWLNEVQEALKSGSAMLQYHALGLLHKIKQGDRYGPLLTPVTFPLLMAPHPLAPPSSLAAPPSPSDPL